VVTAADLLAGDEDPRPGAGSLIARSVATLTAAGVTARPKVRRDVGYFARDIAQAAVEADCDFSLGVTRNPAAWRAAAAIPDGAWRKAKRMRGAQVAVCDYAPAGWPPGTVTVVRRVKVRARDISADPRARRRRTIPKDQLALETPDRGDCHEERGPATFIASSPLSSTHQHADHVRVLSLSTTD
jgi:hypothetical protein